MKYDFGSKLRKVRERKNITMKEVALKAGVTESLISQIERNKISPAIDTLLKLADILEVDLEYLFSDFKKEKKVNLVRAIERSQVVIKDITYSKLSKTMEEGEKYGIEAYYLEIKPNGEKGSKEYGHEGKELGVIIEGEGEFSIGSKKYILKDGDSISFESDVPHILKNTGNKNLKAFWVTTPPKMFNNDI